MILLNEHEDLELYMCKTDFELELGLAAGGVSVYSSIEDLEEHRKCVKEGGCGIVKVTMELVEVIRDDTYYEEE